MGGLKLTRVCGWRVSFFLCVRVFENKNTMGGLKLTRVFAWRVSQQSEPQSAVEQQQSLGAFCRLERLQEIAPSALAEGTPPWSKGRVNTSGGVEAAIWEAMAVRAIGVWHDLGVGASWRLSSRFGG